jgi:PncC family amidohydrolase
MRELMALAERAGAALKARGETVSVAESSSGGLISAALLGVAGASVYYLGGGVIYTPKARAVLMDIPRIAVAGMRSASETYAALLARTARERLAATWGVSETGAAGPAGNPYGDAAGHSCVAISGPRDGVLTVETGGADRIANMHVFAAEALKLLLKGLEA